MFELTENSYYIVNAILSRHLTRISRGTVQRYKTGRFTESGQNSLSSLLLLFRLKPFRTTDSLVFGVNLHLFLYKFVCLNMPISFNTFSNRLDGI